MTEEEKKELQELIDLLYTGNLSQYGKRELVKYIEKQQKEIEELKKENKSKIKIVFKSILECLKILLWCSFIGISITLIGKFIPIVLCIALPIIIICLFITIYNTNKGVEKDE